MINLSPEMEPPCDFDNIGTLQILKEELQKCEKESASLCNLLQVIQRMSSNIVSAFQYTEARKLPISSDNTLAHVCSFLKDGLPILIEIIGKEIDLQRECAENRQGRSDNYSEVEDYLGEQNYAY